MITNHLITQYYYGCDIDTLNQATDSSNPSPVYDKKYVYDNIPASFLNCENSLQMICIHKIERNLEQDANITEAYVCFESLIQTEMKNKLKCIQTVQRNVKPHKSMSKPFWNTKNHGTKFIGPKKEVVKISGCYPNKVSPSPKILLFRRNFDKMLRKAKRRYQ